MASSSSSYETTRRATRALESKLDQKLGSYAKLASAIARGEDSGGADVGADLELGRSPSHDVVEREIEEMLDKLSSQLSALTSALDESVTAPTAAQLHAVQRHREVLMDLTRDFNRSKTNLRHALDRRNLLGNVRGDIDSYKALHGADTDALLAERGRIDNSHNMIDRTLDQAYATRADLASQRQTLRDICTRMQSTAAKMPGLNHILTLINRRRKRDSIIMGLLIGACTVVLLWAFWR